MSDDITFGQAVPDDGADDFLSVLEAGIRETKRLNERLVLISAPEKVAWELEMRVPNSNGYIASEAPKHAKKLAQIFGVEVSTATAAMVIARYCVAILHGGDYAVDCRAERASAFAHPRIMQRLEARDSVEAVLKLFGSESVVDGLAARFIEQELSMDDADVETIEDPSVRG